MYFDKVNVHIVVVGVYAGHPLSQGIEDGDIL